MPTSSAETTSDQARRIIAHNRRAPFLLCGGRPYVGGVFVPKNQQAVGAPTGKVRTVAYSLCERCYRSPDVQGRVEKRIIDDAAALQRVN